MSRCEMSIERACQILNDLKYLDGGWAIRFTFSDIGDSLFNRVGCLLSRFEAVAVAEKIQRDSGGKTEVAPGRNCPDPAPPTNSPEVLALGECINIIDRLPDAENMRLVVEWLFKKYPEF